MNLLVSDNSINRKVLMIGAGRGSRTPKDRSPADFESAASASSAIPAKDGELRLPLFPGSGLSIA